MLRGLGGWTYGGIGYSAAKHGIVGLMRSMANGQAPCNIRVNSVHPTAVPTMMATNDAITAWITEVPTRGETFRTRCPVDIVEPEDITAAVLFLALDDARYITGTALPGGGGFSNKV